jgi:hypothetical protein
VQDGYYIYGLVDPRALRETGDDPLLSIFYVGKGKGSRWAFHEKDVHAALVREQERLERRSSKAERIRKILDRGQQISAIRLSAGYVDEDDAYAAEALAIDTVDAALTAAGRPPLTNATPGRHAGFVWLREHFIFTETTEQDLPQGGTEQTVESGARRAPMAPRTEILVKGTEIDLVEPGQRLVRNASLPAALAGLDDRVVAIELLDEDSDSAVRRGWDPLDPWTDPEARARARRYWPIAAGRVANWLRDPDTMPQRLLLGIPEPGGRTVVRYVWDIDPAASWEFYPQSRRWGIPLGPRVRDHPRLGAALYETRDGRRVQVLLNHVHGLRVIEV